jgi:hypothetical protein
MSFNGQCASSGGDRTSYRKEDSRKNHIFPLIFLYFILFILLFGME